MQFLISHAKENILMPSSVPCPERDDIKLLPSNCSKRMSTYVTVMVSQSIPFSDNVVEYVHCCDWCGQ